MSNASERAVDLAARIRPYAPADRDEVLSFRRAMYGPDAFQAAPWYLTWALDQPRDPPDAPVVWLYRDEHGVSGQVGGYRVGFRVGAARRSALWILDLVVDPAARQHGIGPALTEAASTSDLSLAIEVSANAYKVFRRLGWADLGDVPLHVRPLTQAFFKARPSWALREAAPVAAAAMRCAEGAWRPVVRAAGLELVQAAGFDERSDEAWAQAAAWLPVAGERDRAHLAWRFERFPVPDRYGVYYLMRGARALGYAVLMTEPHGPMVAGRLVDFACARWAVTPLLALAASALRARGADVAYCLCASPLPNWVFSAAGFVSHPSGWPLLADLHRLTPADQLLAGDESHWFVTSGDSNLDRPRERTVYAPNAQPETPEMRPAPTQPLWDWTGQAPLAEAQTHHASH